MINGFLTQPLAGDVVAEAFSRQQHAAIGALPVELSRLPVSNVPLVGVDVTGIATLRAVVAGRADSLAANVSHESPPEMDGLDALVEKLAQAGPGVVMVMGKGGVGKTTIAGAIARSLAAARASDTPVDHRSGRTSGRHRRRNAAGSHGEPD